MTTANMEYQHPAEPHSAPIAGRLNWLRAGVLGANDGIISTAGLVVGVAGATASTHAIAAAGVAGLVAGAVSMALGEYVSVSTQRDSERALISKEKRELEEMPEEEFTELVGIYRGKGLSEVTATQVAQELHRHDALAAHLDAELGIDPDELTSPSAAALSSALAFVIGALLPLVAILLPAAQWRVPVTFAAVILALALTGVVSARLGSSRVAIAVARLVLGGVAAMALTWAVGAALGATALS